MRGRSISARQVDPVRALIGSSPNTGDETHVGVVLPIFPTTQANRRLLVRCCGVKIASGRKLRLLTLRQLLTIGALVPANETPDEPPYYVYERPVVSPHWSFANGNVSWHLRRVKPRAPAIEHFDDVPFASPFTSNFAGVDSGILSRIPAAGAGVYRPPHGGMPYGDPVEDLGTFTDVRFPWDGSDQYLGFEVVGPCYLVLFASVYQPADDPRVKPAIQDPGCLCPEDRFASEFPAAKYRRVGGRMTFELEEVHVPCTRRDRSSGE